MRSCTGIKVFLSPSRGVIERIITENLEDVGHGNTCISTPMPCSVTNLTASARYLCVNIGFDVHCIVYSLNL